MTKVELAVFRIDMKLLAEQRAWLLEQDNINADGITHMIDAILDAAWDSGVLPELDDDEEDDE
jgi:hypothetical protein